MKACPSAFRLLHERNMKSDCRLRIISLNPKGLSKGNTGFAL